MERRVRYGRCGRYSQPGNSGHRLTHLSSPAGATMDNGDGRLTDLQTGLMWEKKDDLGGVHDQGQ